MLATSCYEESSRQDTGQPRFEQNPRPLLRGDGAVRPPRFRAGFQYPPGVSRAPANGADRLLRRVFYLPGADALASGLDRVDQRIRIARHPLGTDYRHGHEGHAADRPHARNRRGFRHDAGDLQFRDFRRYRLRCLGERHQNFKGPK